MKKESKKHQNSLRTQYDSLMTYRRKEYNINKKKDPKLTQSGRRKPQHQNCPKKQHKFRQKQQQKKWKQHNKKSISPRIHIKIQNQIYDGVTNT